MPIMIWVKLELFQTSKLDKKYMLITTVKKRKAKYYPDFYMELIDKDNNRKKLLIEVKPLKETMPPKYKRRTKNALIAEALWSQNQAKWKAAREFCLDHGWEFQLMTEKELFIDG